MLARLLESWAALDPPANTTVRFLVVENDDAPRSEAVVAAAAARFAPGGLDYVLETEPGIPFGRNRAADEAVARGSGLLAFMDDDETAPPDWLVRLIGGYRASDAVLMGAPLGVAPLDRAVPWIERVMHRNIAARYARKAAKAARRATLDATPGVTIVTNNWLGETALFTRHGIRFDEAMRHTGGTDAKFYHEVRTRGLPTGWVADAVVHETIPRERLTPGYQFRRGRDQSNTNFRRKLDRNRLAAFSVLVSVPLKALVVAGLALALPLTGGATLLDLVRTAGWIAGRVGALLGARSALYTDITGN